MNAPTLNEIAGYKEPAHLISVINDLEEKLKVTENLLSFFKKESNKNEELTLLRAEVEQLTKHCSTLQTDVAILSTGVSEEDPLYLAVARAERAEAELAKYLSACPASPTEEERKRCQQWWAISGRAP